jgi:hypothetical protein
VINLYRQWEAGAYIVLLSELLHFNYRLYRLEDAEELHDVLVTRSAFVKDFGFRIYEDREGNFLHRPVSEDDKKAAQV